MKMNKELFEKVKSAKSAEELLTLAKENNIEMTVEDATKIFSKLNSPDSELSDDELDNVSGGGCGPDDPQVDFWGYCSNFERKSYNTSDARGCGYCTYCYKYDGKKYCSATNRRNYDPEGGENWTDD